MSFCDVYRVIAEMTDQGHPEPDCIDRFDHGGTVTYTLMFRHRPGTAERWVNVFDATWDCDLNVPATTGHDAFLSRAWRGTCGIAHVEIRAYLDADTPALPGGSSPLGGAA